MMPKWLDPITAARADLELEVARLREENAKLRSVNEAQAEQIRKAQERIRAAEAERDEARKLQYEWREMCVGLVKEDDE